MTAPLPRPLRPFVRRGHDGRPDLEPGRRLFIAVPVPGRINDLVEGIVLRIREDEGELAAGGGRLPNRVRWVNLDDLHLTVRFLGPTGEERLAALRTAVTAAASEVAPFEVGIGGAGAFPTIERPRALWLGVLDPAGGMSKLADAVNRSVEAAGWTIDDRPYNPHLTLARSDGVRSGPRVARRLAAAAQDLEAWFGVDRLVLYESHTGGGPARYVPLHEARLGG